MRSALGLDLGLCTGAAVLLNNQSEYTVLYRHSSPLPRGIDSLITVAEAWADALERGIDLGAQVCGIDWNLNETYWGNRVQAAMKAFIAAYLFRSAENRIQVFFISPNQVRRIVGLRPNAPKADVFQQFCVNNQQMDEHVADALVLAQILIRMEVEGGEHDGKTESRKPSGRRRKRRSSSAAASAVLPDGDSPSQDS